MNVLLTEPRGFTDVFFSFVVWSLTHVVLLTCCIQKLPIWGWHRRRIHRRHIFSEMRWSWTIPILRARTIIRASPILFQISHIAISNARNSRGLVSKIEENLRRIWPLPAKIRGLAGEMTVNFTNVAYTTYLWWGVARPSRRLESECREKKRHRYKTCKTFRSGGLTIRNVAWFLCDSRTFNLLERFILNESETSTLYNVVCISLISLYRGYDRIEDGLLSIAPKISIALAHARTERW